ncbi:uncharacterized protein LOC122503413 isoform X2 [Leptopilina heterotoma]|uniref:uncharacterized protein LOC122503413 isoform X2 n=1 Tax=Leptopilina heterotoma TaxID=63436 RepID=UPI001CAA0E69|nr:uncharacterized protein LOC122503413 isoform X2 [Leptopilina heterotoma]
MLLNLSVFEPDRIDFRKKVCRLISKIIVSLNDYFQFPLSDWKGGSVAFQNFLSTGLEHLPYDSSKWEENLKISNERSNSLLVLLYCHFIATEEIYVFTKTTIAVNIINLDVSNAKPIFLKVLWLLYAVSPIIGQVSDYFQSDNKLTATFQRFGSVDIYYTHHKSFLLFIMNNISIPDKMRVQIIRLWIDQSKSDEEFALLIEQCIHQGYNDLKIVKILMDLIHENVMENIHHGGKVFAALLESGRKMSIEVIEFVLKTLTVDLTSHTFNNSKILEVVLKIAGNVPLVLPLSFNVVNNCAKGLVNVIIKGDIDLTLKALLLPMSVLIIQQSLDAKNFKAAQTFMKNNEFLIAIFNDCFNSENSTLIEVKFSILAGLLSLQEKLRIKGETIAQVKLKDFKNVCDKIKIQNQSYVCFVTFITQLLLNNQFASPLIELQRKTEALHSQNILYIYYTIHIISSETDIQDQNEIYECLSMVLYYCISQKLNVCPFLQCPATFVIFKNAIDNISNLVEPNYSFQDFAMTWLRHVQWAIINEELKLNTDAKQSVVLLTELRFMLLNMNKKDYLIEDFCSVVDNHLSILDN